MRGTRNDSGKPCKRLEKYKLELNEEKTKQVPFDKRLVAQGVKQGTFDFLGFTFYWGGTIREDCTKTENKS